MIVVACGCRNYRRHHNHRKINYTEVADCGHFYAVIIERNKNLAKTYDISTKNHFIYTDGRTKITIIKNSDSYEIIRLLDNKETARFDRFLNNDTINSLFEYLHYQPLVYDMTDNEYTPLHMDFMLCDSTGTIKLMANQNTMAGTRIHYKKHFHEEIPLNEEQSFFLLNIVSDFRLEGYRRSAKNTKKKSKP